MHLAARDQPQDPSARRRVGLRDLARITRGHRGTIIGALSLALLGSGLGLVQPMLAMRTVEAFTHHDAVTPLLVGLAAVFLAEAVIDAAAQYRLQRCGETIVLTLRLSLVDRLLRLPMRTYHQHRLGDLFSRSTADTTLLRDTLAYDLVELCTGGFVVIGGSVIMLQLDPVLFGLVLAIVVTVGALTTLLLPRIRDATEDAQDDLGRMTAELERALSAIRTVRATRAEHRERNRIGQYATSVCANNLRAARLDSVVGPGVTLAAHGSLIVVLVVGGIRAASGDISLAELVAFLLYVTYVAVPMASLFEIASTLQKGLAALQRVQDVVGLPVEDASPAPVTVTEHDTSQSTGDAPAVELRGVWFGYDQRHPVLRDVSFQVPHNTCVALVGPSGAGKTTIIALLERFYEPDRGLILLDGLDTRRALTIEQCRSRIGLVEQSAPVMHGSLRDNIAYARPDADDDEIRHVLELANLGELVRRLPEGLASPVGEHGGRLSGGECQRVAIARALLARPRVLLLDEPTSQLDTANETALARTIERVSAECALLVITHRPSTIRIADIVVSLAGGQVITTGGPAEKASTQ